MKNPVAPVIHSSRSRSQSEAVVYCAARLTWRTRLTMNMLTPYTRAIPARVPIRREGYHSGIALVYGVSMFMVNRMRQVNRAAQFTTASDWLLLVLLWITGATGFFIEVALYLPNAPVIHSSTSRSQSEAVVNWAARLTWRTRLTMNMLTPYTRAIPARVPIRREGYHSGIGVPVALTPVRARPQSRMVALNRPRKPQIVRAWMSHRRRYNGSIGLSSLQSSRYRRWPSDSTPSAAHSALAALDSWARPPMAHPC